jgi:hypothetical protein
MTIAKTMSCPTGGACQPVKNLCMIGVRVLRVLRALRVLRGYIFQFYTAHNTHV